MTDAAALLTEEIQKGWFHLGGEDSPIIDSFSKEAVNLVTIFNSTVCHGNFPTSKDGRAVIPTGTRIPRHFNLTSLISIKDRAVLPGRT